MVKVILNSIEFNTQKRIEAEKNGIKDGKALRKLTNNAIYGKTIQKLKSRINVRLVNNKIVFKMNIKTKPYVAENIWL